MLLELPAVRSGKKSPNQSAHLGPIWYHSNLLTFTIAQTSFLVGTFFATSYSKTALIHCQIWMTRPSGHKNQLKKSVGVALLLFYFPAVSQKNIVFGHFSYTEPRDRTVCNTVIILKVLCCSSNLMKWNAFYEWNYQFKIKIFKSFAYLSQQFSRF